MGEFAEAPETCKARAPSRRLWRSVALCLHPLGPGSDFMGRVRK